MKRIILLMPLTMLAVGLCLGQSAGDYRSASTGNWNVLATWQRYDGSAWVTPTAGQGTPTNASGAIAIRSGHTVTVTANVTVDQVVVESGGQVTVNGGITLTIAEGVGTDFVCNGVLYNSGTVTTTGTLAFGNGAIYQHARNGGNVPTASWDLASTCLITGIAKDNPGNLAQSFGNFTWNCAGQTGKTDINELTTIRGNFSILSTNGQTLTNNAVALTVGGNFIMSGNSVFDPAQGKVPQYLNVAGNFQVGSGSTFTNTGGGNMAIVFNGTGNQIYNVTGTVINVDFAINAGSTVTLASNLNIPRVTTDSLMVTGTLDVGNYQVTGPGLFILQSTGTLATSNAGGVDGSIVSTGAETYVSGASYTFNGATATPFPAALASVTAGSVDLNANVTLNKNLTVNTALYLTDATLSLGSYTLTYGASAVLVYDGIAAQTTGPEWPATFGNNVRVLNNSSAGVTLAVSKTYNSPGTIKNLGHFVLGTTVISGTGAFYDSTGSTLSIGHASGINGNITVSGKYFSPQANYIYNGSVPQVTGTGLPSSVNNLTIDNSAGVTLTNNCTVNGTLNLSNGILSTGGNAITISGTGTVSRTNGWVNGNLAKGINTGPQSKDFEVGTANGYSPVSVTFGNVSASGTLTAKAVASVHGSVYLPYQCLQRYWTLTNSGLLFNSYDAVFSYLPADFNVGFLEAADEGSMVVGKFQSGSWSLPSIGTRSPGGSSDGGSIQIVEQTSFSDFTLAKNGYSLDEALAVELSSFAALASDGAITLSWRTESENGSYQWIVERSQGEAGPFVELGRLPAAGNSQAPKDYTWADRSALAGVTYCYRIGEMAIDGSTTYFGPVSCSLGRGLPQVDLVLGCAPNPFRQITYIRYQIAKPEQVSLKIYNVAGQCVRDLTPPLAPSPRGEGWVGSVPWDGTDQSGRRLSAGVYLYRISIGVRQFGGKVQLVR